MLCYVIRLGRLHVKILHRLTLDFSNGMNQITWSINLYRTSVPGYTMIPAGTLCVFYTVRFYSSHDAAVAPRVVSLFLQLAPGCVFHIREGVWLPHPVVLHAAKTPHGPVPHE